MLDNNSALELYLFYQDALFEMSVSIWPLRLCPATPTFPLYPGFIKLINVNDICYDIQINRL
jgi:hypothetical protein